MFYGDILTFDSCFLAFSLDFCIGIYQKKKMSIYGTFWIFRLYRKIRNLNRFLRKTIITFDKVNNLDESFNLKIDHRLFKLFKGS